MQDQKFREVYVSASALTNTKKTAITKINANSDVVLISKLNDAIIELKTT